MREDQTAELLEQCLRDLQAGEPLETVLAKNGPEAEALRPVLEMAVGTRLVKPEIAVPDAARARSRAQFLAAAAEARDKPKTSWFPVLHLRAAATIGVIALLLVALVGSGLASAQTIPGDTLYPMKRAVEQARLSLASSPAQKLELEETFDQERAEESQRVVLMGRNEQVSFAGVLEYESGEGWEAAGVPLALTPEQEKDARGLNGMYVEVEGLPSGAYMKVNQLAARLFTISGQVQQAQPDSLVIDGVTVFLTQATDARVAARNGSMVYVTALRRQNGDLQALVVSDLPETATYLPPTEDDTEHTPLPHLAPTQNSTPIQTPENNIQVQPVEMPTPTEQPEQIEPQEPSSEQPSQSENEHSKDSSQPSEGGDHSDTKESGDH